MSGLSEIINAGQARLDATLLRYDGWWLVFVAAIIGIGVGLLAGMAIWCVMRQHGHFMGSWYFKNGIFVDIQCKG